MAFIDKLLNSMRYNDDDDYEDEYFDEEDDYNEFANRKKRSMKSETLDDDMDKKAAPRPLPTGGKGKNRLTASGMEVCVIKPTTVDDAREITETLLANRTVVLNMEGLDPEIGQRIIDFASGSTFAINGNLQKISNYIFIITPKSVDISGDFQEILSGAFEVPALRNKF